MCHYNDIGVITINILLTLVSLFYNLHTNEFVLSMPKVMPEYKEEVRKRIIHAALQIGEEKGLSNIRMGDVAEKMGISRATLYLYFKNRDDLIAEGNKAFCDDVSKLLNEAFGKENYNEVLLTMFDNFLFPEDGYGTKTVVEMFAEAMRDEEMRNVIGGSYFNMRSLFTDFIGEQKREGRIPGDIDPDVAVGMLQSVALGLKMGSIVGLEREEAKKIWKLTIERIIVK